MKLLEAHTLIIKAEALGLPELIKEAKENHAAEMAKRGRKRTA